MTPGLVSIVICAYNNWPDVELTIESALHQSYQPVEIIVVDNSSTDATPQKVPARFGHLVRYMSQPNRGDSGAYNAGFAVACGEFIQFVDGDDVLAPNKIAKQVEAFRANPEFDIVYGDIRKFQTLAEKANWIDVATQPEDDMLRRLVSVTGSWNHIHPLSLLIRRSVIELVGPWDESLYSGDTDYLLRAAWAGCRFGYCPGSPMGFVRLRPGQMTKNVSALERGWEALWEKSLGYITREAYRSRIVALLAQVRFRMAVFGNGMSKREALAKLALARAASPDTISLAAYAIAWTAIICPGGMALARSNRLLPIRRAVTRLLRLRVPRMIRPDPSL